MKLIINKSIGRMMQTKQNPAKKFKTNMTLKKNEFNKLNLFLIR